MMAINTHGNHSVMDTMKNVFKREKHIAPLAVLRIAFGIIMFISTLRFLLKGWVADFYIKPVFHFTFYGFGWVRPLGAVGMYIVFAILLLASLCIAAGFFYRVAITVFFICFTYIELIDVTYYLNHYYFISLFSFLLLLVPAHRYFSLDVVRCPSLKRTLVPGWCIAIFKAQLCLIYFFAGLAKLNADWMLHAMPLRIWLPANAHLPVAGPWLIHTWVAYVFSWAGAFFDLIIGFLLLYKPTRSMAYLLVVVFHLLTGWLFKIGMFPYIMIAVTIIFFSEAWHQKLIVRLGRLVGAKASGMEITTRSYRFSFPGLMYGMLAVYFVFQLLLPFRYLLYPGKLYWTEEGYRFSWRVMLMEKAGTTFFYVKDPQTGKQGEVLNEAFLTPMQERMMETQPDMILQYAHYLHDVYAARGVHDPEVTVKSYVTLNGSGSRLYIDSTVDLAKQKESFFTKKWILPFHNSSDQ